MRKFDPDDPCCERCGDFMTLNEGSEWSEVPGANVCNPCAQAIVVNLMKARQRTRKRAAARKGKRLEKAN